MNSLAIFRRPVFWTLFGVLVLLAGCKVEGELWVERSGEGKGRFLVSEVPITKPELEVELVKKGFEVDKVEEKGPDTLEARVHWKSFANPGPFDAIQQRPDGSVRLAFGRAPELGALTVHLDGKVLESTGYVKDNNTVIFQGGRLAVLTYQPASRAIVVFIALAIMLVAILALVRVRMAMRKPR
jgi:hypothetical protein